MTVFPLGLTDRPPGENDLTISYTAFKTVLLALGVQIL